jgi:hypothetical protein
LTTCYLIRASLFNASIKLKLPGIYIYIYNEWMYRSSKIINFRGKLREETEDPDHDGRDRDVAWRLCIRNSCQHVSTGLMQIFDGVVHLSFGGSVRCCLGEVLAGRLRGCCLKVAHPFDVCYEEGAFSSSLQSGSHRWC